MENDNVPSRNKAGNGGKEQESQKRCGRDGYIISTEVLSHIVCVIWLPLTLFQTGVSLSLHIPMYFLSLESNYISVICMLLVYSDDEDDEKGNVWRFSVRAIDFL